MAEDSGAISKKETVVLDDAGRRSEEPCVQSADHTFKDEKSNNTKATPLRCIEPFQDDGTLHLVRIAAHHPVLKENCDNLLNLHIPEYNSIASEVKQLHSLSPPYCATQLERLRSRCRALVEDLGRGLLAMDCIDTNHLPENWGTKSSVRQTRREMLNISENLGSQLDSLLESLAACPTITNSSPVKSLNSSPEVSAASTEDVGPKKASSEQNSSNSDSTSKKVTDEPPSSLSSSPTSFETQQQRQPKRLRCLWDVKHPQPVVGVYASAPPVLSSKHVQPISLEPVTHKICVSEEENVLVTPPDTSPRIAFSSRDHIEVLESRFSDDAEHEERPTSKRSRPKRSQQIDWGARLREKIDLFKKHTSQGGCVTTFYEHPVNRDTLLSLLAKCEPYLELENPTPFQIKMCIETFIAGLDIALADLQQLRVNKTQMRLLHQSATVLDTLSSPAQLLPEIKSLQGLLKTFGMF